jgi:amino acid transporter
VEPADGAPPQALARSLTLTHAVLYGLGVTIGAGIYVLVGPAVGRAGAYAPLAFLIAAVLMALTAASFAELGTRMPVAAGEAAYVRAGFRSDRLATAAGLMVVAIAVVSAAAISVGSAGYIGVLLPLPPSVIIAAVVLAMGAVAARGVKESVTFAGVMTVIEIGGLMVLIGAGVWAGMSGTLPDAAGAAPPVSVPVLAGVVSATLLAVFAFIGFEGLANIAEEVESPRRTLPVAIALTLAITTLLYVAVVVVAMSAVGRADLAASKAPLALVFDRLTGLDPRLMTVIAIVATLNGIIVQIIMAARVLYGLARQGNLPRMLGEVHSATRAPMRATVLTTTIVLALAVLLPLDRLADWTSRLTLLLFALVNGALIAIKQREMAPPPGVLVAPRWVPWAGVATTLAVVAVEMIWGAG